MRLALSALLVFLGLIVLQLSGYAASWNTSLFEVLSNVSNVDDGFLIRRMAGFITRLSDTYFCVALVCLVLFWGWSVRSMPVARGFAVAMLFIGALNSVLKLLVLAPRPESGQWLESFSFPSGHASAAVAAWTMLAIMAFVGFKRRSLKTLLAGLLCSIGFAVAISRIVIGVHWPLDVLAGIFEGLMVAAVFYRVVYQNIEKGAATTHDPQLLLGMAAVMSVIYVVL